ncbi:MAG: hypothetical protein UW75_C0043G0010 [Parcubacteria group bacterium GW2011_GWF2_44_8]|nr:MAG: hypothetical protein UW75_C0043G0010 [Parcubacteria group bacterium GW2011_GWF2_44_8]
MTNVSKVKTGSPDYKHASQELTQLISKLNKKTASVFINELFTESEKIMITKRFAAALLFNNNFSTYRTAIALGVSISTAQRIYKQYEAGQFDNLINCLSKKEKNEFVELIQDFILSKASSRARARFFNHALKIR